MRKTTQEYENEIKTLKRDLSDAYKEISEDQCELQSQHEIIVELEDDIRGLDENSRRFPYLYLNDQFKCDFLHEHWDKIKLEHLEAMPIFKGKTKKQVDKLCAFGENIHVL